MNATTIAKVPKGEYIKLKNSDTAPVWVRGDYDKSTRTYELHRFDDVNRRTYKKGSTQVFTGFTF